MSAAERFMTPCCASKPSNDIRLNHVSNTFAFKRFSTCARTSFQRLIVGAEDSKILSPKLQNYHSQATLTVTAISLKGGLSAERKIPFAGPFSWAVCKPPHLMIS